jgi:hypothetical protein
VIGVIDAEVKGKTKIRCWFCILIPKLIITMTLLLLLTGGGGTERMHIMGSDARDFELHHGGVKTDRSSEALLAFKLLLM